MTWVTDNNGTRWIEYPPPKRRARARALRFADLKVGDQLTDAARGIVHYLVTDMWFDPVAGQHDETAGRLVGIIRIAWNGDLIPPKRSHTLRGLASQGFRYAEKDMIEQGKALLDGVQTGAVVGIGKGRVIRNRPKLPGARF